MPEPAVTPEHRPKDKWDIATVFVIPVTMGILSLFVSCELEKNRAETSKVELYAQLMSSREGADSQLRQGMFNTIMSHFLGVGSEVGSATETIGSPGKPRSELDVLRLEVLAYNFHDSLDLAPLFQDVSRRLVQPGQQGTGTLTATDRDALLKRLEKVATEVIDKQISTLDEGTNVARARVRLNQFEAEADFVPDVIAKQLDYLEGNRRRHKAFSVDVISINREKKEVEVRLTVWEAAAPGAGIRPDPMVDVTFTVGFFDFPLVDNTRLGGGERCALVLNSFGEFEAHLSLVFFPGSRASLKEKQFYDDIIRDLRRSPGLVGDGE